MLPDAPRRTVNLKILAGVFATVAVLAVGTHFLHAYQVRRNAHILREEAERAETQEKNPSKAASLYGQYLALEPEDRDAVIRHALLLDRLAVNLRDKRSIYFVFENVLRRFPDEIAVRERAVRICMSPYIRRHSDAREHIDILLGMVDGKPEWRAELLELRGVCYEAVSNFELAAKSYEASLAADSTRIEAAVHLAEVQRRLKRNQAGKDTLVKLVKENRSSYQAHLALAKYLRTNNDRLEDKTQDLRQAQAEVDEALRLAPDAADVILAAAELRLAADETDQARLDDARKLFLRGRAANPGDFRFPLALAQLDLRLGRKSEALQAVHDALAIHDDPAAAPHGNLDVVWTIIGLLLDLEKTEEARSLMARLNQDGASPQTGPIDFLDARILAAQGDFAAAAATLERTRQSLASLPDISKQADLLLARCYEQLANPQAQLAALDRVLKADPSSVAALHNRAVLQRSLGRYDDALADFKVLAQINSAGRLAAVSLLLTRNAGRSGDVLEADLREAKRLLDDAPSDLKKTPAYVLLQLDLTAATTGVEAALKQAEQACVDSPKEVRFWTARAALAERPTRAGDEPRTDKALAVLDEADRVVGDGVDLRLARAIRLIRLPAAQALKQLAKLETAPATWSAEDRDQLFSGLAEVYQRAGMLDESARNLTRVIEHRPNDLGLRLRQHDLAVLRNDSETLAQLPATLRQIEGDDGVVWRFEEAGRMVRAARKGDVAAAARARDLIKQIAARRPDWHRALTLDAELDVLDKKFFEATAKYQRSVELGERDPQVLRTIVRLLADLRDPQRAADVLHKLQQQIVPGTDFGFDKLQIDMQIANRDVNEATLDLARKAVPADSKDPRAFIWLGQVLASQAGGKDGPVARDAAVAFRRAINLKGDSPEAWTALVVCLAENQRPADAEYALAQALKVVPESAREIMLATCNEAMGRREESAQRWRELVKGNASDPFILRSAATFFLRNGNNAEAEPLLMKLAKGYSADARWARRSLALLQAAGGDYTKTKDALGLIQNNVDNTPSPEPEDLRARALIQALRASSRGDAIKTFEQAFSTVKPTPAEEFLLGRLYELHDQWPEADKIFKRLLGSTDGGKNRNFLAAYIDALLRKGLIGEVEPWLKTLQTGEPKSRRTAELTARWHHANGATARAVALIREYVADQGATKDPSNLVWAAALIAGFGEAGDAEKLYLRNIEAADEKKKPQAVLLFANFLATHNRLTEALDQFESIRAKTDPGFFIGASAALLRAADDPKPDQVKRVLGWAADSVRARPDSSELKIAYADVLDVAGGSDTARYVEAEDIYAQLIAEKTVNVLAMNNLAWLLAVREHKGAEALSLLNRALEITGPDANFLDTLGTVELSLGKAQLAATHFEQALAQTPSVTRYFHLAQARMMEGDRKLAEQAWRKSRELSPKGKLFPPSIHPLERPEYARLREEFDGKPVAEAR